MVSERGGFEKLGEICYRVVSALSHMQLLKKIHIRAKLFVYRVGPVLTAIGRALT